MYSLHFINLIQAGSVSAAVLGGLVLWRVPEYRGIAIFLSVIALASLVNILEESGLTRDIYLVSPVFVVLAGPAMYLAALWLTKHPLRKMHLLHLLPTLLALGFTSHAQAVIAAGTVIRVIYAVLTAYVLVRYKQLLDEERSDADDYSLAWLVWFIVVMTLVNFIDLLRLNLQPAISHDLNLMGQAFNNLAWLVAILFLVVKLLGAGTRPRRVEQAAPASQEPAQAKEYQSIFEHLDAEIRAHEWYRQPRLTLGDLSQLSGLQSRDISRAINLVAHRSFNDYINGFRISHVCSAIDGNTSHSMTHLYTDAGFSSKASFNQIFKKATGQTPSEYKKQR